MRVTSKGQVTIPRDLRERVGIAPNSEVVFAIENGRLTLAPKQMVHPEAERDRLARFIETLDRLEGSGAQDVDADALMRLTRDR